MLKTKKSYIIALIILLSVIFTLVLTACILPFVFNGQLTDPSGNASPVGATADNPILISTAREFSEIKYDPTKYYRQTQDIDLSEVDNFTGLAKFFQGHYDGQRFKIKNVVLNKSIESGVGLFGINRGTIINVIIESGEIVGDSQVGAIAGSNLGLIEGCTNNATVLGSGIGIGGIVGTNNGEIKQCSNRGNVKSTGNGTYLGGIVGSNLSMISQCYNTGSITEGMYIGGIAGNNDGTNKEATISECYNIGSVEGIAKSAICGDNWNGVVENIVYSNDTGLDPVGFNSGQVSGVVDSTLVLMTSKTAYSWDNFDTNWLFMSGYKYPSLIKEYVELVDVDFTGSPNEVQQGEEYQFKASFYPANATPVKLDYELITGTNFAEMEVESGKVSIADDANIGSDVTIAVKADGKTFTHAFKIVKNAVEKVELSAGSDSIVYGEQIQLNSVVYPDNATYPDVTYIYNDEFVTISDSGVMELKRGCPANYEFTVRAKADGIESDALSFIVNVISPQDLEFPLGNDISVKAGDIIKLRDYITVAPYNAQYKFLEVAEEYLSASILLYSDLTVYVDALAQQGVYDIAFTVDGTLMPSRLSINVVSPSDNFDFNVNPLVLTPNSSQLIVENNYDNNLAREVSYELVSDIAGVTLEERVIGDDTAYYINIAEGTGQGEFTVVATTSDGLEIAKRYSVVIPVEDILVEVNNNSGDFCTYAETNANGDMIFDITPNSKTEGDRTELLINLTPTMTTFSNIRYIITEHEEIVQYDQLNDGTLLLKLYPLSKTVREDGTAKQFIIRLYAGDCEKTLIFRVVPVEVKEATMYEKNGYSLENMYVGNTYNIVLEPDSFATDLTYEFVADALNKSYIDYSINRNILTVKVIANPANEETLEVIGRIKNVETSIQLHIKVAVEELSANYIAELNKFEAGRQIQCVTASIYPSNASNKDVIFRVTAGYECIMDEYLGVDEEGYYLINSVNGVATYRLKAGVDYIGKNIMILAVAHNGVTSEYTQVTVERTTIDELEMTSGDNSAIPTVLKQEDALDLKVNYAPVYYVGEIEVVFPANRSSWYDFVGKENASRVDNELIYKVNVSGGSFYIEGFTFTENAVIEEEFIIKVRVGNMEKQYVIDIQYGIELASNISLSGESTFINLNGVKHLESAEVTINYRGQAISSKIYSFEYGNDMQTIDLTQMLCFIMPDSIDIKYNMRVHYNDNAEENIVAKDVYFELNDKVTGFTKAIGGNQESYWNQYKTQVTGAYLDASKFASAINVPSNIKIINFIGSGIGRIVNVENRATELDIVLNAATLGGITIDNSAKTSITFVGKCDISATVNKTAISASGDIELTNDGGQVNITSESGNTDGTPTIKCSELIIRDSSNITITGSKGKDGVKGADGSNGSSGSNGHNNGTLTDAHGKTGGSGSAGKNGTAGSAGAFAIQCAKLTITNSTVKIIGGDGGNGGSGGKGGYGGKGGNGADTAARDGEDDAGNGGKGGNGGNGGDGSIGGNGATAVDSDDVIINNATVTFVNGRGGKAGEAGDAGNGGAGGTGGADTKVIGQEGYGGNGGNGGNGGYCGTAGKGASAVVITSSANSTVSNSAGVNGAAATYSRGIKGKGGAGGSRGVTGGTDDGTVTNGSRGSDGTGR